MLIKLSVRTDQLATRTCSFMSSKYLSITKLASLDSCGEQGLLNPAGVLSLRKIEI